MFFKYPEMNTDYSEPVVFLQVIGARGKKILLWKKKKRLKKF